MNESPNNNTGLNDTFSSQPSPQTNPFTADLKGEFTSNFGTNTNAVSQIFKEGGFVNNSKTKYLIIGGVLLAVLGIGFYFFTASDDSAPSDEVAADTDKTGDDADSDDDKATKDEKPAEKPKDTAAADAAKTAAAAAAATAAAAVPESEAKTKGDAGGGGDGGGKVSLSDPSDGSSLTYDESQGPAVFSWTGGGGHIVFSRNSSMHPVTMRVAVSGNSYNFNHPWPGTWYWKVENSSGATEVRSFKVSPPPRRNIALSAPAAGGSVAGNGGTVNWTGDGKVAYYRVELSTGSWANPQFRFSSSGNSLQLQGVQAGPYQMRLGAFSEVAGRWEYTAPVSVTVQ